MNFSDDAHEHIFFDKSKIQNNDCDLNAENIISFFQIL